MDKAPPSTSTTTADETLRVATAKVMRHLLPMMVFIYFLSFIDRTNVALAKSAFQTDLGITPAMYGFGAGIFFWGYALLEVPSNLLAHRVGPRRWIARIAVTWGALSAAMMFVQGEWSFYAFRLLLGVAEAGLFPALMYVTTLWFAQRDRAVAVGWIYTAPAMGLTIGNPLGGALMQLDGLGGLHGWQWMFLLEGVPTVIFGIVLWFIFPDRPRDARWLTPAEAAALESNASGETVHQSHAPSKEWISAIKRPSTIVIALIYLFNQIGFVGLYFFVPSMVQQMQANTPLMIGLLSSTVGIGFLLGVLILPRVKRFFTGDMLFLGLITAGLLASSILFLLTTLPAIQLVLFTTTAFFAGGILPIFWSVAMKRLHGIQAAAGLAFINTIGLIGGFIGPYIFGLVEKETGRSASGFAVIALTSVLGLVLIPILAKFLQSESEPHNDSALRMSHP
ncbi:major facilitator superfamily MFS_1 [Methylobacterium sp. 4-46]|uniref:MFS transporter n=1 Tax=unclassified Methylobacterium TaxID=2615210 RepID=UPI000152D2C3|nr:MULTISPECIES: MFS transporter [Methylobacterium]ACA19850.1 major facilitator superfamily MFS_1 [Methylobacterium sp. 4-46]WFT79035.1 MFS transporter [Methylobacterium nodulans]